jgi:hypothetical protein
MTRRAQPLNPIQLAYGKVIYSAVRWLGFQADNETG